MFRKNKVAKIVLAVTLLSTITVQAFNGGNDETTDCETIKFSHEVTDGAMFTDVNDSKYFVDYETLESGNVDSLEDNTTVDVQLNEYGEILSLEKSENICK